MITSAEMNPSLAQTVEQARAELARSAADAAAQQQQARTFIVEHGAAANGGHEVRAAERF